jgi:hypothetical protein
VHVGGGGAGLGVVGPGGEERDHVVLGHGLDLGHGLGGRRRRGANRPDRLRGHRPRPGVGLKDKRLHPAPELVLVGLGPDQPHRGQRIPVDHASTVAADRGRAGRGEDRDAGGGLVSRRRTLGDVVAVPCTAEGRARGGGVGGGSGGGEVGA